MYDQRDDPNVLIVSPGGLGDLVCLTSVYRALVTQRGIVPDVAVAPVGAALYFGQPNVGRVFNLATVTPPELAAEGYTHAIVVWPSLALMALVRRARIPCRVGLVTARDRWWQRLAARWSLTEIHRYGFDCQVTELALRMLASLGVAAERERRQLYPTAADTVAAERCWEKSGLAGQRVVGMSLDAGQACKRWPVARFAQVADDLVERYGVWIMLVGGLESAPLVETFLNDITHREAVVNLAGEFSLPPLVMAACLHRCALFVAVDTGPLHVANAVGVPVVDIMGPVDGVTQHPIGQHVMVFPKHRERFGGPLVSFYPDLKHAARFCRMAEEITVPQVLAAVDQLLASG